MVDMRHISRTLKPEQVIDLFLKDIEPVSIVVSLFYSSSVRCRMVESAWAAAPVTAVTQIRRMIMDLNLLRVIRSIMFDQR